MNLPELPKQNKQLEADFGIKLRNWLKTHHPKFVSCTFETKDSHGKDYLNYSEVTEKQIAHALLISSDEGDLIRVSSGTEGAPDYNYYRNAPAYIVIHYPKNSEVITIQNFLHERDTNKRKSLTSERAKAISSVSINKKPH